MTSSPIADVENLKLERIGLLKAVLQGFRSRLDEELHPLGITTAQLRVLWTVEVNPGVSGAKVARLCSVTPQTGQALLARLEADGWIQRHASAKSDRVLVAELTASGRRVLLKAKEMAEALDRQIWAGIEAQQLHALDQALTSAVGKLSS